MTHANQITILKALEAISGLTEIARITALLNPEAGFKSLIQNLEAIKKHTFKIESAIAQIKEQSAHI